MVHGLPAGFNLRIALHCGPVYCGATRSPDAPLYTGPHTSRAARIEPITPPGQVYASSAFAAVAAASGTEGISLVTSARSRSRRSRFAGVFRPET